MTLRSWAPAFERRGPARPEALEWVMHALLRMERRRVVCPLTGRFEEIELEGTEVGVVVLGCSRFDPRDALECGRPCAAELDRRDREHVDDRAERVLVASAADPATHPVSELLACCLARDGLTVELADADARAAPPAEDYDAVILVSRVRLGRHPRSVVEYIDRNRATLAELPTACIAIGDTARVRGSIGDLARATGWSPAMQLELVRGAHGFDEAIRELARTLAESVPPLHRPPSTR